VPDIFLADEAAASAIDRCHSLRSLASAFAALPSLPPRNDNPYFKLLYKPEFE
jgi:hypothetical protein